MQDAGKGSGLNSISDIKAALSRLEDSGVFTLKLEGTDTIMGELKRLGENAYDALNPKKFLTDVQSYSFEIDNLRASMAKTFGVAKDDVGEIQRTLALSYQNVIDLGGQVEDVAKVQDSITKSLHTNLIASTENVNDLFATYQATNVPMNELIGSFREAGFSMVHIKDEMQKVVDYSRSVGVNVTAVSDKVTDHIGKLNLYNFENGIQGLAKMAAQSSMLSINMETTFKLAEDLMSPEKAIEMSSALQRLGVTSSQLLDPLRAMDLAQNDPAELQNQLVELSKQFVRTKEDGSFEILPGAKRQMKEIESALGMSRGELAKMALQSAETSKKLSEISFPSGLEATQEQKMLIANLAQLNKQTGKYEISLGLDDSGKEIKKSIDDLPSGSKELQEILQKAQEKPPIEDLARDQLSELRKIRNEGIKLAYGGRLETAAGSGDAIIKAATKEMTDFFKGMSKGDESEKMFMSAYEKMGGLRGDLKEGKPVTLDQVLSVADTLIEGYIRNSGGIVSEGIKSIGNLTKELGFTEVGDKIIKFGEDMKSTITTFTVDLKNVFNDPFVLKIKEGVTEAFTKGFNFLSSNDALIDLENNVVHQFAKGDIIAAIQEDNITNRPNEQKEIVKQIPEKSNIVPQTIYDPTKEIIGEKVERMTDIMSTYVEKIKENQTEKIENKNLNVVPNEVISEKQTEKNLTDLLSQIEQTKSVSLTNLVDQMGVIGNTEIKPNLKLSDIDINANIHYKVVKPIEEPEIKDLDGKINYNIGNLPTTPEIKDIVANIDYKVGELPKISEIEDLNGNINYHIGSLPETPSIENVTAFIDYKVGELPNELELQNLTKEVNYEIGETPKNLEFENQTAFINYEIGNVPDVLEVADIKANVDYEIGKLPETPKFEDVISHVHYKLGETPDLSKIENLKRTVNYELGEIPKNPEFENSTVLVNYKTGEKPEKLNIEDITGHINYETGKVSTPPEIKDITAHVNYEVGNLPNQTKVEDLKANVNYSLGELPENPEMKNLSAFIDYKTGSVEELKLENKVSKINYVKGDIEEFELPDTKDMVVNVKFNVEDLKLPEIAALSAKVKLEIENQNVSTELSRSSLDIINDLSSRISEIKYDKTQVAVPDTNQNVRPNVNTPPNTIASQEIKVNLGEMKIVLEIPGLNNNAETQRVATEALHNAFNNETFKRNLSQMMAQGISKTNGILNTTGSPNYVPSSTESNPA